MLGDDHGETINGIIEHTTGLVTGQVRTLKAVLEYRIDVKVPFDVRILC